MPVVAARDLARGDRAVRHTRGIRVRPGAAASSGSRARRPRRSCSSSRRGGARSRPRRTTLDAGRPQAASAEPRGRGGGDRGTGRAREAGPGLSDARRSTRQLRRRVERARTASRATSPQHGRRPRASTPPLRARVDAGAQRSGELGDELRRLGAAEVGLRQRARRGERARSTAGRGRAGPARCRDATRRARRLESAGDLEPAEGDDRDELAARAERLEVRRVALGQVNPLAREEYEAERERLEDLKVQREDLERSLEELERLRVELAETVERRFAETFASVAENFEEVAATLFPGGEGRLRLVEAGREAGRDPRTSRPASRSSCARPANGSRASRSSPAARRRSARSRSSSRSSSPARAPSTSWTRSRRRSTTTNIARFVELLRRYSDRAQFVVVTHQKRTMEAADVLYGVTMGPDGRISGRVPPAASRAARAA